MRRSTDPERGHRLIVVGADFTSASKAAMERAKQVATATDSSVLLAHIVPEAAVMSVIPSPGAATAIAMPSPSAEGTAALKAAADLADERVTMDMAGLRAEAVVRVGSPPDQLASIADRRGAWLLIVGVRAGLEPTESLVLGTTVELALRRGSTPVLLARDRSVASYRRVLLPLEPDDLSLLVLRAVAVLAPDADYDVIHFLPKTGSRVAAPATHRDAVVAELTGLCAAGGLDPARTTVGCFSADPRDGILAEVRLRRPDLVAMGTHARSGLARVAFGSLADHVIHAAAGVDVLAVPPESRRRTAGRTVVEEETAPESAPA